MELRVLLALLLLVNAATAAGLSGSIAQKITSFSAPPSSNNDVSKNLPAKNAEVVTIQSDQVKGKKMREEKEKELKELEQLETLMKEGKSEEVLKLLEEGAATGNSHALFKLGELYEEGLSVIVDQDFNKAVHYYNQSAAKGHPGAQKALGLMYDIGKGVPVNKPLALLHYEFAAKGGNLEAQATLGYKYLFGDGVHKSCEKAAPHYRAVAHAVAEKAMKTGLRLHVDSKRLMSDEDMYEEEEDVVQFWQYSAEGGKAPAQVTMGTLYLKGAYGVEQNFQQAFRYFKQAADQGNVGGKAYLGFMYAKGYGVKQNNETAIKYLTEAAEEDNAQAQAFLGHMYFQGGGVEVDLEKAAQLFRSSAEKGYPEALLNMGNCYFYGEGTKQDYSKALQYYMAASHGGELVAQFNLAQMHWFGLVAAQSCNTAVVLYKRVAEKGEIALPLLKAYELYQNGDIRNSLHFYERAAEMGFELAQSNAAFIYDTIVASSDDQRAKAFEYYRKAAEQQNPTAYLKMGDYYYYGIGTSPDLKKAAAFYRAASDMGNAQATFNLGYMHQHGEGLPQDFYLAKRYYDLTYEYNQEALVPVYLALGGLGVHFLSIADVYTTMSTYFPQEVSLSPLGLEGTLAWDTALILLFGIVLVIAITIRQRVVNAQN